MLGVFLFPICKSKKGYSEWGKDLPMDKRHKEGRERRQEARVRKVSGVASEWNTMFEHWLDPCCSSGKLWQSEGDMLHRREGGRGGAKENITCTVDYSRKYRILARLMSWPLVFISHCTSGYSAFRMYFDPFTIGSQVKKKQHLHSRNLASYSTEGVVRV